MSGESLTTLCDMLLYESEYTPGELARYMVSLTQRGHTTYFAEPQV